MPGGDRTGPEGRGPLTGRGRGRCGPRPRRKCGLGPRRQIREEERRGEELR